MFMFRRKRNNLIRRLLKARIRRDGCDYETGSEIEDGGSGSNTTTRLYIPHHHQQHAPMDVTGTNGNNIGGGGGGGDCETLVRTTLLKKLEDTQLELLTGAVESRGADLSDCVLLSRTDVAAMGQQAHVLCCQMWRWPELRQAAELKRLPVCESANDTVYICCNPYHWSRLCEPESPPPPYSRFAMDQLKPEDRAPSEIPLLCGNRYPGSLTTSGEGSSIGSGEWCKLAYWELTQRVGNQFPVRVPSITVFENDPRGNGLCLATLQHNFTPPDSVRRTRAKIGHGVILSQEVDGVWAYNISDAPIFVNSPTLIDTGSRPLVVYRVPPGHCLCIHDPERAANRNYGWHFTEPTGPIDPNSIRISFVKGWGPKYSRQEITACPCWLEVLLAPCR